MSGLNLLAIDTTTEACSAALVFEDNASGVFEVCPRLHAQKIIDMAEQLLKEQSATGDRLDAVVVGQGPGAFTGIRIGAAVAQGLACGFNKPLVGVSTLKSLAWQARGVEERVVIALIDARMNEVYCCAYKTTADNITPLIEECLLAPSDVASHLKGVLELKHAIIGVGTGWAAYKDAFDDELAYVTIDEEVLYPTADSMLEILLTFEQSTNGSIKDLMINPAEFEPTYLRNKVAKTILEREGKG